MRFLETEIMRNYFQDSGVQSIRESKYSKSKKVGQCPESDDDSNNEGGQSRG